MPDCFEAFREICRVGWKDKPDEELIAELKRISEISLSEPIHLTKQSLYEKFMVLGNIWKERCERIK